MSQRLNSRRKASPRKWRNDSITSKYKPQKAHPHTNTCLPYFRRVRLVFLFESPPPNASPKLLHLVFPPTLPVSPFVEHVSRAPRLSLQCELILSTASAFQGCSSTFSISHLPIGVCSHLGQAPIVLAWFGASSWQPSFLSVCCLSSGVSCEPILADDE